jgi:hypothetical protein
LHKQFFSHPLFPTLQKKHPDRDYEHHFNMMCEWYLSKKKRLPIAISAFNNWLSNTKPDPEIEGERKRREAHEDTQKRLQAMSEIPQADPNKLQALRSQMASIGKQI